VVAPYFFFYFSFFLPFFFLPGKKKRTIEKMVSGSGHRGDRRQGEWEKEGRFEQFLVAFEGPKKKRTFT